MTVKKLAREAHAVATEKADQQSVEIGEMVYEAMGPVCDQCLHTFELGGDELEAKCNECPAYIAVSNLAYQSMTYGTDRAVLAIAADLLNRGE